MTPATINRVSLVHILAPGALQVLKYTCLSKPCLITIEQMICKQCQLFSKLEAIQTTLFYTWSRNA